nr:type II toxin-antitoxin system RelE/ParE family toxin [uncultured Mogibacterium sp.]
MDYRVVVTEEAEEDLNRFIQYLLFIKKNHQAAINVLDDFEDTVEMLKHVAGSLKMCDNPRLEELGYHRINFQKHRYFILYRIENDVVYVDDIFHELQDYENRMI